MRSDPKFTKVQTLIRIPCNYEFHLLAKHNAHATTNIVQTIQAIITHIALCLNLINSVGSGNYALIKFRISINTVHIGIQSLQ